MQYSFQNCTSLETVDMSNLTSATGSNAMNNIFSGSSIQSMYLPNLTTIGTGGLSSACLNCTSLVSVDLSKLVSVGARGLNAAFKGCTHLKTVKLNKLSNTGTSGNNTLVEMCSGCTALEVVDFSEATAVPVLSNVNAFTNTNSTYKIVVPDSLYSSWIAATNWSNANIQPHIIKASEYQPS
jgi:hypothetical protein